ncbi:opine metallophore biosynthesis dehydrogenase [Marinicrinis sediminis]|uniref:Opine metallophore biosynthesis dehydrogenase n=1 Tax=Marinicrinis sediminis TaxID=1652465 RepID=A0ABW5R8I0_9BACL
MRSSQRILIAGTGPVSVQLAVCFQSDRDCVIGISGRRSLRAASFFHSLEAGNYMVRVHIQNPKHQPMEGSAGIHETFTSHADIQGQWDMLVLAVTADAYIEVLEQISNEVLEQVQCVVLLSPTFGSNYLIQSFFANVNRSVEIISFSSYLGDTRWLDGEPSSQVITTGVKKKIYLGSTVPDSASMQGLYAMFIEKGLLVERLATPLEAETRNISLYVHPPLFMNEFSLRAIFGEADSRKYVYKLYPEGPITPRLIADMRAQWKEIMHLLSRLNIRGMNLLQFMIDDHYPVPEESLSRADIEQFEHVPPIHQQYLLFVRYASLLIDPFSKADGEGRYFDFSAVPIRPIYTNAEGCLDMPRMPKEDYYRIKIIQGIARFMEVPCPTIDRFIETYEQKITAYARQHANKTLSSAFTVQSFEQEISMIKSITIKGEK